MSDVSTISALEQPTRNASMAESPKAIIDSQGQSNAQQKNPSQQGSRSPTIYEESLHTDAKVQASEGKRGHTFSLSDSQASPPPAQEMQQRTQRQDVVIGNTATIEQTPQRADRTIISLDEYRKQQVIEQKVPDQNELLVRSERYADSSERVVQADKVLESEKPKDVPVEQRWRKEEVIKILQGSAEGREALKIVQIERAPDNMGCWYDPDTKTAFIDGSYNSLQAAASVGAEAVHGKDDLERRVPDPGEVGIDRAVTFMIEREADSIENGCKIIYAWETLQKDASRGQGQVSYPFYEDYKRIRSAQGEEAAHSFLQEQFSASPDIVASTTNQPYYSFYLERVLAAMEKVKQAESDQQRPLEKLDRERIIHREILKEAAHPLVAVWNNLWEQPWAWKISDIRKLHIVQNTVSRPDKNLNELRRQEQILNDKKAVPGSTEDSELIADLANNKDAQEKEQKRIDKDVTKDEKKQVDIHIKTMLVHLSLDIIEPSGVDSISPQEILDIIDASGVLRTFNILNCKRSIAGIKEDPSFIAAKAYVETWKRENGNIAFPDKIQADQIEFYQKALIDIEKYQRLIYLNDYLPNFWDIPPTLRTELAPLKIQLEDKVEALNKLPGTSGARPTTLKEGEQPAILFRLQQMQHSLTREQQYMLEALVPAVSPKHRENTLEALLKENVLLRPDQLEDMKRELDDTRSWAESRIRDLGEKFLENVQKMPLLSNKEKKEIAGIATESIADRLKIAEKLSEKLELWATLDMSKLSKERRELAENLKYSDSDRQMLQWIIRELVVPEFMGRENRVETYLREALADNKFSDEVKKILWDAPPIRELVLRPEKERHWLIERISEKVPEIAADIKEMLPDDKKQLKKSILGQVGLSKADRTANERWAKLWREDPAIAKHLEKLPDIMIKKILLLNQIPWKDLAAISGLTREEWMKVLRIDMPKSAPKPLGEVNPERPLGDARAVTYTDLLRKWYWAFERHALELGSARVGLPFFIPRENLYKPIAVIAPTGSGKTAAVLNAFVNYLYMACSLLVYDCKNAEIFKSTKGKNPFHTKHRIAFDEPGESATYNPLAQVYKPRKTPADKGYAKELQMMEREADILARAWGFKTMPTSEYSPETKMHAENAQMVLKACVMELVLQDPNGVPPFAALADLLKDEDICKTLSKSSHPIVREAINVCANLSKEEYEPIHSLLTASCRSIKDESIKSVTGSEGGRPTIDLAAMVLYPTALYVTAIPDDMDTLQPYIGLIQAQMECIVERVNDQETEKLAEYNRGKDKDMQISSKKIATQDMRVIFEESGMLGQLHHLDRFFAVKARYGRWQPVIAAQTFFGLGAQYRDAMKAVLGNVATVIIRPGAVLEDCKYFSEQAGTTTVEVPFTETSKNTAEPGVTTKKGSRKVQRPLIYPEEIAHSEYEGNIVLLREMGVIQTGVVSIPEGVAVESPVNAVPLTV